jgi:hypothetical protein
LLFKDYTIMGGEMHDFPPPKGFLENYFFAM